MHKGANERVLRHLLGAGPIARHHDREAKETALVELNETRESHAISAANGVDRLADGALVRINERAPGLRLQRRPRIG
jgi:hypothetical protein